MDLLPVLILRVLHFLYALVSLIHSFWKRQTQPHPQSLQTRRRKLPKNLAVIFVVDTNIPSDVVQKTIFESLLNLVEWCRTVGIPKLTIYEQHGSSQYVHLSRSVTDPGLGLVLQLEPRIREAVFGQEFEQLSSDSEMEYQPLTPPASVYSESRQVSPCHSTTDVTKVTILRHQMRGDDDGKRSSSTSNYHH